MTTTASTLFKKRALNLIARQLDHLTPGQAERISNLVADIYHDPAEQLLIGADLFINAALEIQTQDLANLRGGTFRRRNHASGHGKTTNPERKSERKEKTR